MPIFRYDGPDEAPRRRTKPAVSRSTGIDLMYQQLREQYFAEPRTLARWADINLVMTERQREIFGNDD